MKVVSYYNVVPQKNKSQEKFDILTKFPKGVKKLGDDSFLEMNNNIVDCDVAVIQGWQHHTGKSAPHLSLRQKIIETQLKNKKYVCTADSNLFLFANSSNQPHHYLRYSFNGVFPNSGIYFDDNPNPARWRQISHDLNINLHDYKKFGSEIVLCLQRNGGWSMGEVDVKNWVIKIIKKLRQYSDRNIRIRPHPKDKKFIKTYMNDLCEIYKNDKTIKFSSITNSLDNDLENAWAVINHNSSSIVGPLIKGYYSFITDPQKSQCKDVANTDLSKIENPLEFDREKWLERISMFHWKFEELENGKAWAHMRNYVCQ
jgi:hypothetical protein